MSWKRSLLSIIAIASILLVGFMKMEVKATTSTEKKIEQGKSEGGEISNEAIMQAYKDAVTELDKSKKGQAVDFDKVTKLYKEKLQGLVQEQDAEFAEQIDQIIVNVLEAGKSNQMDSMVTKQMFDKLMQKEFFQTIRHEFKEIDTNWGKKEGMREEYEEAMVFYKAIEGTVGKRDAAYGTKLGDTINNAFNEMKAAIEKDDRLAFSLSKQVVDKSLMKTFYLATGAVPHGYATKAAETAKKDEKEAKIQQSEGWAFYQCVYPYLKKVSAEDADFIFRQFDLQTDVKTLNASSVNKAFICGFVKVALSEYKQSKENFGQDRGAVTALEAALFIDMISLDLKSLLGEQETANLTKTAQVYLDAVKGKDKANTDKYLPQLEATLNKVLKTAKYR